MSMQTCGSQAAHIAASVHSNGLIETPATLQVHMHACGSSAHIQSYPGTRCCLLLPQVGLVQADMSPEARRAAYLSDITYVTNSELGFDYLRDNLAGVRRGLGQLSAFVPFAVVWQQAGTPHMQQRAGTASLVTAVFLLCYAGYCLM
jgi:hypothetical protein